MTIKLLDAATLQVKETFENVIDPVIYEQHNSDYRFSFETTPKNSGFLLTPNKYDIFEVDGDHFQLARLTKERNSGLSVKIESEHISYDLNDFNNYIEEIEDSPGRILQDLLDQAGTQFTIGSVDFAGEMLFKPGDGDPIRSCIIDLANRLGGDLLWHKNTVSILSRRGVSNGPVFKIGENLKNITVTTENQQGSLVSSLDIDVLDLAHLPGFEALKKVNLGDTVNVIDTDLGVNTYLRVLAHEYDPFQKVNASVQIGHVVRNFTDYILDFKDEVANIELEPVRRDPMLMTGSGRMEANASITTPFDGFWLEFGTVELSGLMTFDFKYAEGYDEVLSLVTGIRGDAGLSQNITVVARDVVKGGKITGIEVMGNWEADDIPDVKVSVQAVCRIFEVIAGG
ncbi:hypothetical protein FQ087_06040 [Sporosarcina sp. ANT_H38]|uniref:phage tail protein n=1 Tax=Sporosarcina sp. ANT_H38 TaxID=2597358 RepID=UPI0011F0D272|nr:phage tail protein [Sporosarcina sp. ANT_H38]KAA0965825.1 hypothetical protein FQ087_06040 [Sporosarcina sp. ANT_H38]